MVLEVNNPVRVKGKDDYVYVRGWIKVIKPTGYDIRYEDGTIGTDWRTEVLYHWSTELYVEVPEPKLSEPDYKQLLLPGSTSQWGQHFLLIQVYREDQEAFGLL